MAEDSWQSSARASGVLDDDEVEALIFGYTPDGLFGDPTDAYAVFGNGSGREVHFRADRAALLRGCYWQNDADLVKAVAANASGSIRYDLACLEMTRASAHAVRAKVVTGTPGAGVPPTPVRNALGSGVYQLPLASIKVVSGATVINGPDVVPIGWWLARPTLLTSTTSQRPPADKRQALIEWESGQRLYSADGSTWTSGISDSGWVDLTPAAGWGEATAVQSRKINGQVFLAGSFIKTGASLAPGTDSTLVSVPAAHKPGRDHSFLFYVAGTIGAGTVHTDGTVRIEVYSPTISGHVLIPHGITYPAATP